MGKWQLEVFRMAAYVSFPIACFYLFNKPDLFKEYIIDFKQKYYPPENLEAVI